MKTGIQMVKEGRTLINVNDVTTLLTGNIYLFERPKNSTKIDIVVNSIVLTNEQLQQGVFNYNIHAPNKADVVVDDVQDNSQPDVETLEAVTNAVMAIVADYVGEDFRISAQTTGLPIRDVDNTWYVNIRANYSTFQPNYSNI